MIRTFWQFSNELQRQLNIPQGEMQITPLFILDFLHLRIFDFTLIRQLNFAPLQIARLISDGIGLLFRLADTSDLLFECVRFDVLADLLVLQVGKFSHLFVRFQSCFPLLLRFCVVLGHQFRWLRTKKEKRSTSIQNAIWLKLYLTKSSATWSHILLSHCPPHCQLTGKK